MLNNINDLLKKGKPYQNEKDNNNLNYNSHNNANQITHTISTKSIPGVKSPRQYYNQNNQSETIQKVTNNNQLITITSAKQAHNINANQKINSQPQPNSVAHFIRVIENNQKIKTINLNKGSRQAQNINSRQTQRERYNVEHFQRQPQKKMLPYILKNICHKLCLIEGFQKIKFTVYIKKISLSLLKLKKKRSLEQAFYQFKLFSFQKKESLYDTKIDQLKSAKLFCSLFSKIIKRKTKQGLQCTKIKVYRTKKIYQFVLSLEQNIYSFYQRQYLQHFLTKLKLNQQHKLLIQKYLKKILLSNKKLRHRLLSYSYNKIINFCFIDGLNSCIQQRKQKNKEVSSLASSRKTVINEQKQILKKLKHSFDSVNLQKNRSFNELKKSRTVIKQQMNIDIKSMKIEQEEWQEEVEQAMKILQEKRRLWNLRFNRKMKAQNEQSMMKVMKIYNEIEKCSEREQLVFQKDIIEQGQINTDQLKNFQTQNPQYLFYDNLQLLQTVYLYEKVKKTPQQDLDPEYVQKREQNTVLKELIGSLVKRQVDKSVYGSIIKFNNGSSRNQGNFSFSPIKMSQNTTNQLQQKPLSNMIQKEKNLSSQNASNSQYFLPNSSKNSKKSSYTQNSNLSGRIIGKITSKANYFNS